MKPLSGDATGGEAFDPQDLPEEASSKPEKAREAPAPGLPISEEEYRRMKEAARHTPARRDEHAQEDHPEEKKEND
jgi:hypothetical protein